MNSTMHKVTEKRTIYQPGDMVPEMHLVVDSNHQGLPWPVDSEGNSYYGLVVVHPTPLTSIYLDAKTGQEVSQAELVDRLNNEDFDYERRFRDNSGRRNPVPNKRALWYCLIAPHRWSRIPAVLKDMRD